MLLVITRNLGSSLNENETPGWAYTANPHGTHLLSTSLHPSSVAQALSSFLLLYSFLMILQPSNMTTGSQLLVREDEDVLQSPDVGSIIQDMVLV